MQRKIFFELIITSILLTFFTSVQASSCNVDGKILRCSVTGISTIDSHLYDSTGIDSIEINYSGTVVLNVIAPSINSIMIKPAEDSDDHTLQISAISTTATRIELHIRLSTNQASLPLFTSSSSIIASASTLSIHVVQIVLDANNFKIFDISSTTTTNLADFELTFHAGDDDMSNPGVLNLPDLIRELKNVSSIRISGNGHSLAVNGGQMPTSISVNRLVLKKLRLHDQVLYNFMNLNEYFIEECTYNRTARFLKSNQENNVSLTMTNNNPLDLTLPNDTNAFNQLLKFKSITLVEPRLNSTCLRAIKGAEPTLKTLVLNLGSYFLTDFSSWKSSRSLVWYLTIMNITDLNIFPSKFFNSFDALHQVKLQGTFALKKSDICTFVAIKVLHEATPPIVSLESPQNPRNWDKCADTYIKAINYRTLEGIECPPDDTCEDCVRWAKATDECSLSSYENQCLVDTISGYPQFFYNESHLNSFFQTRFWLNRPTTPSTMPSSKPDSLNIGAIIGAICGLLIAIIILGITIFCIYQHRRKDASKNISSMPTDKYIPSSDDAQHVSIATSKTSQSSRYALQRTFFPPMQPNDEIAPPLYTAPSESVGSVSAYMRPTAPSAPRDSISTHATHLYETLDS